MGIAINNFASSTEDRASGAQVIDGSLRFDSDKNQYLYRDVSVAGNRRTWTISFWCKLNQITGYQYFFSAGTNLSSNFMLFQQDNSASTVAIFDYTSSFQWFIDPAEVFRDPSSWYHFVINLNTTTQSVNFYVNNRLVGQVNTAPSSNYEGFWNSNVKHRISDDTNSLKCQLSQFYSIDGQALGPEYFGYTDPLTNTWRPKKLDITETPGGSWGTNGFYLPFDGSAPIGEDKSGNGNNWTPVNFGGSVALDNPIVSGALPILNTDGGGKVARVGVRTDADASSLVLALPLVGSANDVSNQINSGSTTKTITSTNAVANYAFSNFYGGSWYFDGTDDGIAVTNTSQLDFGSDDFTIEMWFYDTVGDGSSRTLIATSEYTSSSSNNAFAVYAYNKGIRMFDRTGSAFVLRTSDSQVFGTNTWNHFAWTRTGSENKIYVNGNLTQSWSNSITYTAGQRIFIGANDYNGGGGAPSDYEFNGYIQDVRVYKGVVKYTSNFIPASTSPDILPDTPSGVSGGSKLTKITDGAVSFDGSGDYLSAANSADFQLGTGDFTIELFAYFNDATSGQSTLVGMWGLGTSQASWLLYRASGNLMWYTSTDGSSQTLSISAAHNMASKSWNHIAYVRNSGTTTIYVNGRAIGSTASSINLYDANCSLVSGYNPIGGTPDYMDGFISNLRIINGTALYTSDFTPPSAPLTAVANTKLLCCQSNTQAGAASSAPNMGGINSGVDWTEYVSGGNVGSADYGFFDGSIATNGYRSRTGDNNGIVFTPSGGISFSTSVEIYSNSGGSQLYQYNGGSSTAFAQDEWVTVASGSGTLNRLYILNTVNSWVYLSAIRVDGNILIAPIQRFGNVSATNFNPFNTDINTVRGQETGYATLNPLDANSSVTLSSGNLLATGTTVGFRSVKSTVVMPPSGKWYFECVTNSGNSLMGVATASESNGSYVGATSNGWSFQSGGYYNNSFTSGLSLNSSAYSGDTVMIAVDRDTQKIWFGVNGIWGGSGNPSAGLNAIFSNLPSSDNLFAMVTVDASGKTVLSNFGQNPFKFPPPEGFLPLNAANVRPSTVIARPDQYVGITTWKGDGGTGLRTISADFNFKPDFVWEKVRTGTDSHILYDSVRGFGNSKALKSNSTVAEGENDNATYGYVNNTFKGGIEIYGGSSAASDSFTNEINQDMVAWTWKAGGNSNTFNVDDVGYASAAAAGLDGGSLAVTGASVGTKQGFSIIKTNLPSSSTASTFSHGLNQAPDFALVKPTGVSFQWDVYHSSLGKDAYLVLNSTAAQVTSATTVWNSTAPTSSLFSLGTAWPGGVGTDEPIIAYLWHDVPGLQKFGSYTGNGDVGGDGPFIELGFRPALVIIKVYNTISTEPWVILDTKRRNYNPNDYVLYANLTNIESTGSGRALDFLSNGFKVRTNNAWMNQSSVGYVYAAWAEAPTFNLYGAQSNAR